MARLLFLLALLAVSASAHPRFYDVPDSSEEENSESTERQHHHVQHSPIGSQDDSQHGSQDDFHHGSHDGSQYHHVEHSTRGSKDDSRDGSQYHHGRHSTSGSQEDSQHGSQYHHVEHSTSGSEDGSQYDRMQDSRAGSKNGSQEGLSEAHGAVSEDEVSRIVQRAFENGELLGRAEWAESNRRRINKNVQRDTSRYQSTPIMTTTTGRTENRGGTSSQDVMMSDDEIVFPDNKPDTATYGPSVVRLDPAPICEGSTFCEGVPFYPEDLVKKALQQNVSLKLLAGVDVITNVTDVVGRIDVTNDVQLCLSREQVIFPRSAESEQRNWHLIVNQEGLKQGIRIETCLKEGAECKVIDGLIEGYKTSCKQRYVYRELAAIMEDGNIAPAKFRFPSSCCCHVKFTGNAQTRLGVTADQTSEAPARTRTRK